MRILYLTGREITYTRNDVLLRAFRRFGEVDVVAPAVQGGILTRSLRVLLASLARIRSPIYDFIFVGFFGQFLMIPIGRLSKIPVLFDVFISAYDTMTDDRQNFSPDSFRGQLARMIDLDSTSHATHVLIDTPEHKNYFVESFHLPPGKISSLPVGCNEEIFFPRQAESGLSITVLYYCTFLPLHGAEFVVEAAAALQNEEHINFRLIGNGPEFGKVHALSRALGNQNIKFIAPLPLTELAEEIAKADICLGGHFGTSAKADRVVPGKVYQIIAMAKPVIAGDTQANQTILTHLDSAYLCPPGQSAELADAIRTLATDPYLRASIARGGRAVYEARASEKFITAELGRIVEEFLE